MNSNTLSVLRTLSSFITFLGFSSLTDFLITAPHGVPHSGILGSGKNSFTEVIESIVVHILQLVSLSQPVPGSEILGIDFDCIPVGLDSARNILHFEILMAHEGPGCEAGPVQFECLPEIDNSFQMFTHE